MTARDSGPQNTTVAVRVRADGDVDEQALAYVRAKVDAALNRPGLPAVSGEVRISRAPAHHAGQPWSAEAAIRLGRDLVVVHAQEASATELADRLQDRLRGKVESIVHRGEADRRSAAPPPWRGGRGEGRSGT